MVMGIDLGAAEWREQCTLLLRRELLTWVLHAIQCHSIAEPEPGPQHERAPIVPELCRQLQLAFAAGPADLSPKALSHPAAAGSEPATDSNLPGHVRGMLVASPEMPSPEHSTDAAAGSKGQALLASPTAQKGAGRAPAPGAEAYARQDVRKWNDMMMQQARQGFKLKFPDKDRNSQSAEYCRHFINWAHAEFQRRADNLDAPFQYQVTCSPLRAERAMMEATDACDGQPCLPGVHAQHKLICIYGWQGLFTVLVFFLPEAECACAVQSHVRTVTSGIYGKEEHFMMELIQNADDLLYDSSASRNELPTMAIWFGAKGLTIGNNENGFQDRVLDAL